MLFQHIISRKQHERSTTGGEETVSKIRGQTEKLRAYPAMVRLMVLYLATFEATKKWTIHHVICLKMCRSTIFENSSNLSVIYLTIRNATQKNGIVAYLSNMALREGSRGALFMSVRMISVYWNTVIYSVY